MPSVSDPGAARRPMAFFDLDGTLLPIDTQLLFHDYVLRKTGRWRVVFLLVFLPFAILKALRLVSTKTAKRAFLSYLCGLSSDQVSALREPFVEEMVKPLLFPEVLQLLEEERWRRGALLILNTASPSFYATAIASQLDFDYCFCTEMAWDQVFPLLPRIPGENNKHEAKLVAMTGLLPPERPVVDSRAFSDSAADLPMLSLASAAVLVHPNHSLRRIGEQRGWEVTEPKLPWNSRAEKLWGFLRLLLGFNLPSKWLQSSSPLA